jgi:MoxR-like ATPase
MLVALLANGHALLVGVPGLAKTLLVQTVADALDLEFSRIQFTPDLMPTDITGTEVIEEDRTTGRRVFRFVKGPIFANIVLADEINRTPPRTQSALLEAMSDDQASVDGKTHRLPRPFMVIATQNPFEFEGTYPLPESQMDRFLIRISMGYPDREEERQVLISHRSGEPVDDLRPVIEKKQIVTLQNAVREVTVEESIHDYLLDIVEATRNSDELHVGVSTRGAICLYRAAQALALIEGRQFVVPDDIKQLAVPVLSHRVIPKGYLHGGQRQAIEALISRLVEDVPVPE